MGRYSEVDTEMKKYEHRYRRVVDPTDYLLVRLDGRAFHSFTRSLQRPYDTDLMLTMDHVTAQLCSQIQGVRVGYTQSDEISLLITGWKEVPSEPHKINLPFGGVEAKILSLTAAIASSEFNYLWGRHSATTKLAQFDSRLWTFPGTPEGARKVVEYFEWRRADAFRNSISMAAQNLFSAKELHKVPTSKARQMMREVGEPWEDLPTRFKYGRHYLKEEFLSPAQPSGSVTRTRWAMRDLSVLNEDSLNIPSPLKEEPNENLMEV